MTKLKQLNQLSYLPIIICALLISYQLLRVTQFASVYGGFEHDGGWMLTISRSLAEQGTYTTMVSTITDVTVLGAVNVDQKFDIQAEDGRIWFFTGNGIGPASIIPNAFIIKLLGTDFWSLKAGPLIFYTFMLILACYILHRLAGLGAVLLFHSYLFFYPHLSIFLAYEAMGEVPAMFYILWAYLAFGWALMSLPISMERHKVEKNFGHLYPFFFAGLIISLALNAKLITLWSVSGIWLWAGILWLLRKLGLLQIIVLGIGSIILTIVWELVHLVVLTYLTGFELYQKNLWQRIKFILDDGSGVGLQIHSGSAFFWDKFFMLTEVAHSERWVTMPIFLGIMLGGLFLIWLWRDDLWRQSMIASIWLGWAVNTIWFVGLAKTGWARHYWFGLILAIMLASTVVMASLKQITLPFGPRRRPDIDPTQSVTPTSVLRTLPMSMFHVGGRLMIVFILLGFIAQPYVLGFHLPDAIVPYWQTKQINNKYHASLPWIIIPRADQEAVVNYINQLPTDANVFYPSGHKNAEIPAQTGRIHYPLKRRAQMAQHQADIVLIGPSLISPWMNEIRRADLKRAIQQDCPNPDITNEFYWICVIDKQPSVE